MKLLAKLAALTVPILVVAAPAESYAASCQAMRAELAQASSGGGGGQAAALEKRARAMGCRGNARFGMPQQCMTLNAQIARARGGGGGNSRRARQLQQQIARQCNGNQVREARVTRQQRRAAPARAERDRYGRERRPSGANNFFANLFGGFVQPEPYRARRGVEVVMPEETYRRERRERRQPTTTAVASTQDRGDAESAAARRNWSHSAPRGSNFKTWCVRLCDGFYFPASQNTSSSAFPRQLSMCVNQCPSAEVSLYAHNASSAPERMVSAVTGEPYVDLPTAFAYRKTFNPTCGCGAARAPGEGEILEANNGASGARVDVASTAESVPEGVARVKSLIEPSGFGGGSAAAAAAYAPEASASLAADAAMAAANAQAEGDAAALAAVASASAAPDGTDATELALASPDAVVPESQLAAAAANESGAPMTLMPGARPAETEAKGGGIPPTDVNDSLRFRQVGPRFYAARESAVTLPSLDPAQVR